MQRFVIFVYHSNNRFTTQKRPSHKGREFVIYLSFSSAGTLLGIYSWIILKLGICYMFILVDFNVFLYFYHVCSDYRIDIFRCLLLYSRLLCKGCKVTDSSTNRTYDILTTPFLYFHLTACFQ